MGSKIQCICSSDRLHQLPGAAEGETGGRPGEAAQGSESAPDHEGVSAVEEGMRV